MRGDKHEGASWILADILLLFKTFCLKKGEGVFIRAGAFNRNNTVFVTENILYLDNKAQCMLSIPLKVSYTNVYYNYENFCKVISIKYDSTFGTIITVCLKKKSDGGGRCCGYVVYCILI